MAGSRSIFLIGGGRDADSVAASHRPFVTATGGGPIVGLVVDEGDGIDADRWIGTLRSAGARDVELVTLAVGRPVRAEDVAGAAGVYVAGGLTPLYRELLVDSGTDWLPADAAYAGYSAGAAVAATDAITGGWCIGELEVCSEDASEDLDQVEYAPGLGLVPFAVDVHASQWGTLTRLVHAVSAGIVTEGWAIDEHTCLSVVDGTLTVAGIGSAYHVTRGTDGVAVRVAQA